MRRSLKIRGRRKEKEKLPSGITADYSASFFAQLDRDVLDDAHQISSSAIHSTQSDSSEASLTSLTNNSSKNLPPLPPKPPKRGILKGPRLNVGPSSMMMMMTTEASSPTTNMHNGSGDGHIENNLLVRNTLQNEVIAYQNLPFNKVNANRDELQLIYGEDDYNQVRRSPQQMHQFVHGQQDTKLLHVSIIFIYMYSIHGVDRWTDFFLLEFYLG